MPKYDAELLHPPGPVAHVTIRQQDGEGVLRDVPMLIDSGADVSLVPEGVALQIGLFLASDTRYELVGFDGQVSQAQAADLEMDFLGETFRGRFLVYEKEYGILGRDVLNFFQLVLDGPAETWSGSVPASSGSG